jgi:hypothetical protein
MQVIDGPQAIFQTSALKGLFGKENTDFDRIWLGLAGELSGRSRAPSPRSSVTHHRADTRSSCPCVLFKKILCPDYRVSSRLGVVLEIENGYLLNYCSDLHNVLSHRRSPIQKTAMTWYRYEGGTAK